MSSLTMAIPGQLAIGLLVVTAGATAVLSAAAYLASLFLGRQPAIRHCVLLAGLLASLSTPLLSAAYVAAGVSWVTIPLFAAAEPPRAASGASVGERPANNPTASTSHRLIAAESPAAADDGQREGAAPFGSTLTAVLLVWLCGSIALMCRLARSGYVLRRLLLSVQPISDAALGGALAEAVRKLCARCSPKVSVSPLVRTPLAAGVLRPMVVLPVELPSVIGREQLCDVLMHEIAHIERGDNLVVLLQAIARIAFWPIPFVHLLNRELAQAREEICDNHVLSYRDAKNYGETLLQLAQLAYGRSASAAAGVGILHWRGRLEDRICGFLQHGRNQMTYTRPTVAIGVLAVFLCASIFLCGTTVVSTGASEPNAADTHYARPQAKDQKATAEIPAQAWSRPKDGLRVALWKDSPSAENRQLSRFDFVVENASDREIRFSATVGRDEAGFGAMRLVVENDGKPAPQKAEGALNPINNPKIVRFLLKPKERCLLWPWMESPASPTEIPLPRYIIFEQSHPVAQADGGASAETAPAVEDAIVRYQLRFAESQDVARSLVKQFAGKAEISEDPRANAIIVKGANAATQAEIRHAIIAREQG